MSDLKNPVWNLPELIRKSGVHLPVALPSRIVRQLTDDSREVIPDTLFVAVKGNRSDGHAFVDQAVYRGARVVLLTENRSLPSAVLKIRVADTRPLLGPLAHAYWGSVSERLRVVSVTGTNGKTTVSWLIRHFLEKAGIPCGLIGTVSYQVGGESLPSENTTPGAVRLQRLLAQMKASGLEACSMEVSSHALDQHRTDGIRFTCAVFTNFSSEHLDYHGTLENYRKAKWRLFETLDEKATAVVNRDDPQSESILEVFPGKRITFALSQSADLTASEVRSSLSGTTFLLKSPQGASEVSMRLIGKHNVENCLAAFGAGVALGIPVQRMAEAVGGFPGVPGRLEAIEAGQRFPIFVDYAHTDGALRRILQELRAFSSKRICVVFGCGGDRDRFKRHRMGRVAAQLADRVIVTSDNPRSEDPQGIAEEVAQGLRGSDVPWQMVLDRKEAIRLALEEADEGWVVLIAGKGHETGQIVGNWAIPFDDRQVVRELLRCTIDSVRK